MSQRQHANLKSQVALKKDLTIAFPTTLKFERSQSVPGMSQMLI